ncbi:lysylphosphatidylglycerol synthase transmembrane domain-containing protein [Fontibacter flavus]|uniref:Lysylphosphatidylglycerol synthase transmembrane domain-containing protein n=1 Tax=Fontibacter flavus TaxID=654838 RepID=A0ABV6FRK3_9BACT
MKQWVQVVLSLAVAIWIFWFLYKDLSIESLMTSIAEVSWGWLGLSIFISLFGFWIRAWRWKLLIEAGENFKVTTGKTLIGLMIGYLVNLLVPRAGEVARCGVLSKTENIQVGKLLGTVILERTVDLLFLALTVLLAFVLEREVFLNLFNDLVSYEVLLQKISSALPLILGGLIVAGIFVYFLFNKYRDSGLIKKLRHFLRDMINGLISVKRVKNQFGFWGSSAMIWFSYYLMMLLVAWAIPSTASLSLSSVLMVMVMGSIGMVAPVQGGIGTFHALVAFILMAYGLTAEEGKIFAVIIHGSQVLTILIVGIVALGIFFKITSQKASKSS